jgi:hypothetical protein
VWNGLWHWISVCMSVRVGLYVRLYCRYE